SKPPEAAHPHRKVRVALLELHPDAGADLRDHERPLLLAGDRHAGHGPTRGDDVRDVGHDHLDAPDLLGVGVGDHRRPVEAVELLPFAHAGTLGRVEMRPFRASEKLCLYSPRLMLWVTLLT